MESNVAILEWKPAVGQAWAGCADSNDDHAPIILCVGERRVFVRFGTSTNASEDSIGLARFENAYRLITHQNGADIDDDKYEYRWGAIGDGWEYWSDRTGKWAQAAANGSVNDEKFLYRRLKVAEVHYFRGKADGGRRLTPCDTTVDVGTSARWVHDWSAVTCPDCLAKKPAEPKADDGWRHVEVRDVTYGINGNIVGFEMREEMNDA
jgi:hypothetical protein